MERKRLVDAKQLSQADQARFERTETLLSSLGKFSTQEEASNWAREGSRVLVECGASGLYIGSVTVDGQIFNVLKENHYAD